MVLRSSAASPFVRKVRIAISLLGFDSQISVEAADTNNTPDALRRQNPLGKIPVLIAEDGNAYYDSRVILEFLDERAGGGRTSRARPGRGLPRCGCKRCRMASSMLRFSRCMRHVGARPSITSKSGSIIRPAK